MLAISSLAIGMSSYLFMQSAFSVSPSDASLSNRKNTMTVVNETVVKLGGSVKVADLPPPNATNTSHYRQPFLTPDPKAYAAFEKQLESGQFPLDRLPHVPGTPIRNDTNLPASEKESNSVHIVNLVPQSSVAPKSSIAKNGFEGFSQSYANPDVPPDVQVAVGPSTGTTYVFEMVNSEGGIWTKQGTPVESFSLANFFSFRATDSLSDPKVLYDSLGDRWFAEFADFTNSTIKIAVSDTNDPTGSWHLLSLPYVRCPDFPRIATSDDKFVISTNDFTDGCADFVDSHIIVLDKNQMISNINPSRTEFTDPTAAITPAKSLTSTNDLFMASTDPAYPAGSNTVTIYKIFGPASAAQIKNNVTATAADQADPPKDALQPGTSVNVAANDHRALDAAWFKGKLWLSFTDSCVPAQDIKPRSCVHLFWYNTTSALSNEVEISNANTYYFFPALTVDKTGGMDVIFGYSSPVSYPGLYVTGQAPFDQPNSVEPLIRLRSGSQDDLSCRYGDYFGAATDPSQPLNAWVAGEYHHLTTVIPGDECTAAQSQSPPAWSTWIASISLWCQPPTVGGWTVSSSCTLGSDYNAQGDIYLANNAVLTVPSGVTLNVQFATNKLYINPGSEVLIKPGGKIK